MHGESSTSTMAQTSPSERREFLRLDYRRPLKFRLVQGSSDDVNLATTSNISPSGVLFKSKILPKIASILWMNLDIKTLQICRDIENRVLVHNNGILGRVVRIDEDRETDSYRIGVCFVTRDDSEKRAFAN